MPASLLRPDLPPRWPATVRAELERRQLVLAGLAAPEVLDVGSPDGRDLLRRAVEDGVGPSDRGRFATVVSTAGLVRLADLGAAVAAVDSLLAPDGVLYACEPAERPGPGGLLVSSAGALLPPVRGVHVARDLPAVLRATGYTMTDVERFTMPTLVWPLRPFLQLRAVRTASLT